MISDTFDVFDSPPIVDLADLNINLYSLPFLPNGVPHDILDHVFSYR